MNQAKSFRTVMRYASAYGWRRTLAKIAGRKRNAVWLRRLFLPIIAKSNKKHISIIGCGQAAFSTIAYYLTHNRGAVMLHAYDTDSAAAESMAAFYSFEGTVQTVEALLADKRCTHVYIASNHASHAYYTLQALQAGKIVFTEKPLVTSDADFTALTQALSRQPSELYVGYNRPFSPAVRTIVRYIRNAAQPLTLLCYVHGHRIPAEHWYRHAGEGTRICGNAGHWIDLFVHLYAAVYGQVPEEYKIIFTPSDANTPDDDFTLTVITPGSDLFTLVMSSRNEPQLGVRENIELQCGAMSARIDDFQSLTVYADGRQKIFRYHRKNIGHRDCVLQPFAHEGQRQFHEILASTAMMLQVMHAATGSMETPEM